MVTQVYLTRFSKVASRVISDLFALTTKQGGTGVSAADGVDAITQMGGVTTDLVGAADGVCPLGADSKVPAGYLPTITSSGSTSVRKTSRIQVQPGTARNLFYSNATALRVVSSLATTFDWVVNGTNSAGATTVNVRSGTMVWQTNITVKFGSDPNEYVISGSDASSITISPALVNSVTDGTAIVSVETTQFNDANGTWVQAEGDYDNSLGNGVSNHAGFVTEDHFTQRRWSPTFTSRLLLNGITFRRFWSGLFTADPTLSDLTGSAIKGVGIRNDSTDDGSNFSFVLSNGTTLTTDPIDIGDIPISAFGAYTFQIQWNSTSSTWELVYNGVVIKSSAGANGPAASDWLRGAIWSSYNSGTLEPKIKFGHFVLEHN